MLNTDATIYNGSGIGNFGAVQALAVALYLLLLAAWFTVATRTLRGIRRGDLLYPA